MQKSAVSNHPTTEAEIRWAFETSEAYGDWQLLNSMQYPIQSWEQKRLPTPGVENAAFVAPQRSPASSIAGGGTIAGAMSVTQAPQVFAPKTLYDAGLGGLQPGQIVMQGLAEGVYDF